MIKKLIALIMRKRLKSLDFTVISSNCWGAEIYRELGIEYRTPFVGTYMFIPCYIKMLKQLKEYLSGPVSFISVSKYREANIVRASNPYPVGLLGNDVEIHFMHYKTEVEAEEKWKRRITRINWQKLFIQMSDRDGFTLELLEEFQKLDFKNKVCFTSKPYPMFNSVVWIKQCQGKPYVMDGMSLYKAFKKYFKLISWLNSKA